LYDQAGLVVVLLPVAVVVAIVLAIVQRCGG
jgi:hypothetical protein